MAQASHVLSLKFTLKFFKDENQIMVVSVAGIGI